MGLALADAFDLGRMQAIDLPASLLLALLAHALGEMERAAENVAQRHAALDPARDVALHAAEKSPDLAQRLVGALGLLGVRIALMRDERVLADPFVRLPQNDAVLLGEAHQPLARTMHEPGVRRKGDGLLPHGGVDDDWRSRTASPRRFWSRPKGKDKPAKLAQKDRDARWTVKYTKAKLREDGARPPVDLAIPAFGYKHHVSIDRAHGLIRKWTATHAAAHDGARLEDVLDRANTASEVYADTAYRSAKNEAMLLRRGFASRIHRKKPKGKAMPERTRVANAQKSKVRSPVEHVFAHQKGLMGLFVRTIGLARARLKIGLANLAYNMRRFVWLRERGAPA